MVNYFQGLFKIENSFTKLEFKKKKSQWLLSNYNIDLVINSFYKKKVNNIYIYIYVNNCDTLIFMGNMHSPTPVQRLLTGRWCPYGVAWGRSEGLIYTSRDLPCRLSNTVTVSHIHQGFTTTRRVVCIWKQLIVRAVVWNLVLGIMMRKKTSLISASCVLVWYSCSLTGQTASAHDVAGLGLFVRCMNDAVYVGSPGNNFASVGDSWWHWGGGGVVVGWYWRRGGGGGDVEASMK